MVIQNASRPRDQRTQPLHNFWMNRILTRPGRLAFLRVVVSSRSFFATGYRGGITRKETDLCADTKEKQHVPFHQYQSAFSSFLSISILPFIYQNNTFPQELRPGCLNRNPTNRYALHYLLLLTFRKKYIIIKKTIQCQWTATSYKRKREKKVISLPQGGYCTVRWRRWWWYRKK